VEVPYCWSESRVQSTQVSDAGLACLPSSSRKEVGNLSTHHDSCMCLRVCVCVCGESVKGAYGGFPILVEPQLPGNKQSLSKRILPCVLMIFSNIYLTIGYICCMMPAVSTPTNR